MQGLDTIPVAFTLSGLTSWNIVLFVELRVAQLVKNSLGLNGQRNTISMSAVGQQRLYDFLDK
jgi:hypothetical protein